MKTIPSIFICAALALGAFSCKKDNSSTPVSQPSAPQSYMPLSLGNYWIYQLYLIDNAGNATPTSSYDSCYISSSVLIHGNVYYSLAKPDSIYPNNAQLIRDSLNYLVDQFSHRVFSSSDFSSILFAYDEVLPPNDTTMSVTTRMADINANTIVPAGTFQTLNAKTTYRYKYATPLGYFKYINRRFAAGIGIVSETLPFYTSSNYYVERRLVRYHLQ